MSGKQKFPLPKTQSKRAFKPAFIASLLTLLLLISTSFSQLARATDAGYPTGAGSPMPSYSYTLILVNHANGLPAYLEPADLVGINSFVRGNANMRLRAEAATALQLMLESMRAAGVTDIFVSSSYRSFTSQSNLFANRVAAFRRVGYSQAAAEEAAARWVMPPGHSEHQTGLAIDFSTSSNNYRITNAFATTPAGRWLAANSANYGFILRYPEGKEDITGINFEPWHFRYVGRDHALFMVAENLALEEYHARLREAGQLFFITPENERRVVFFSNRDNSAELPGRVLSVSLARKYRGEFIITIEPYADALFDTLGHWAELNIRRLHERGIITGFPDGSFRPAQQVSRAEFVTMLARLELEGRYIWPLPEASDAESIEQSIVDEKYLDEDERLEAPDYQYEQDDDVVADDSAEKVEPSPAEIQPPMPFLDIDATAFYYRPLELIYRAGLLRALDLPDFGRVFAPNQPLLRAEAALILAEVFMADYFQLPAIPSYSDIAADNPELVWAAELLTAAGIFTGDAEGLFRPEREISRAEVATIFVRLVDLLLVIRE